MSPTPKKPIRPKPANPGKPKTVSKPAATSKPAKPATTQAKPAATVKPGKPLKKPVYPLAAAQAEDAVELAKYHVAHAEYQQGKAAAGLKRAKQLEPLRQAVRGIKGKDTSVPSTPLKKANGEVVNRQRLKEGSDSGLKDAIWRRESGVEAMEKAFRPLPGQGSDDSDSD